MAQQGWLVSALRCLEPQMETLEGSGASTAGGWNYPEASSLLCLCLGLDDLKTGLL